MTGDLIALARRRGFKPHQGGPNPAVGATVRVLFRDGTTNEGPSDAFFGWTHEASGRHNFAAFDIIGYQPLPKRGQRMPAGQVGGPSKADFLKSPERVAKERAKAAEKATTAASSSSPGTVQGGA